MGPGKARTQRTKSFGQGPRAETHKSQPGFSYQSPNPNETLSPHSRRFSSSQLHPLAAAQDAAPQETPPSAPRYDFRYTFSAIDDATGYSNLRVPVPKILNQVLIEPSFSHPLPAALDCLRQRGRAHQHPRRHAHADPCEGDRIPASPPGTSISWWGRRIVRWGTGYAFTAAACSTRRAFPPIPPTGSTSTSGRDMVKADYVHGPHALTLAWSTAALASAQANMHDTTALRYNVLVHGFDTALIAGKRSRRRLLWRAHLHPRPRPGMGTARRGRMART